MSEVIVTSPDELARIVSERVREALGEFEEKYLMCGDFDIISEKDVIEKMRLSRATLFNWRKENKIKGYQIGSKIFYRKSEILSSMEQIN